MPQKRKVQQIPGEKHMALGIEQATRPSHFWRRLYVVDKAKFVFRHEIKLLVPNRDALGVVGDISRQIHIKCSEQQAWIREGMQMCALGGVNPVITGHWHSIFAQFLRYALVGTIRCVPVDWFDPKLLDPISWVLSGVPSPIGVPFLALPVTRPLMSKFKTLFDILGVPITDDAIFGLACQLIVFANTICLDILSQYLQLELDQNRHLHVIRIRSDCLEIWDPSIYDKTPEKDHRFIVLNQIQQLKKKMMARDTYKATVWHELLHSEYFNLLSVPFDYPILHNCLFPGKSAIFLQKYFIRLQMKMRRFIETQELKTIGEKVFLKPGETTLSHHYYHPADKKPSMAKCSDFLRTACRKLLNDEEMGVRLFGTDWENYAVTICTTGDFFVEHVKFVGVAKRMEESTLIALDLNQKTNDEKIAAHRMFIMGQLLRFVLTFAAHTIRITLKMRMSGGRLTHVKFDGISEIPKTTQFAEMSPKAVQLAQI